MTLFQVSSTLLQVKWHTFFLSIYLFLSLSLTTWATSSLTFLIPSMSFSFSTIILLYGFCVICLLHLLCLSWHTLFIHHHHIHPLSFRFSSRAPLTFFCSLSCLLLGLIFSSFSHLFFFILFVRNEHELQQKLVASGRVTKNLCSFSLSLLLGTRLSWPVYNKNAFSSLSNGSFLRLKFKLNFFSYRITVKPNWLLVSFSLSLLLPDSVACDGILELCLWGSKGVFTFTSQHSW